jgi:hypothetical protein
VRSNLGSTPLPTEEQLAVLGESFLQSASFDGDSDPTEVIEVVTTTSALFKAVNGSFVEDDSDVHVVAGSGDFTASGAHVRSGPLPTGHFLFDVFDAKTLELTDWGLLDDSIDLSGRGPAIQLDLH